MKNFRKTFNLLLAVAMVMTMVTLPIGVSAATETTTLLDTDFTAPAFSLDGVTVDSGVGVVESGDSARGAVLAIGTDSTIGAEHGITKTINVTEGTVNLSMYAKPNNSQWLQVFAQTSAGSRIALLRMYYHNTNGYSAATYVGGTEYSSQQWSWIAPMYTEKLHDSQWYKVEMVLNLDGTASSIKVTDPNGAEKVAKTPTLAISDIASIRICNNNTCTAANLVDDILITSGTNTLLNENFERFSALSGLTIDNGVSVIDSGDATRVVQYAMSPDDLGLMAMPAGPKRHVTLLGGAAYCMNPEATEDQIDAAIRWIETTYNHKLTEEFKINRETTTAEYLAINQLVGVQNLSPWSENAESLEYERKFKASKANSNLNHVKLYNDFVIDCPADIQPEEPVCCQELYTILDSCIQEVLTNKDADIKTILEKANSDFQKNYLDNLTY